LEFTSIRQTFELIQTGDTTRRMTFIKMMSNYWTVFAVVSALATSGQMAFAGTPEQNRAVGFSDGCHNKVVPGHHTPDYEAGFAEGQAQCSHSNGGSSSGSASSSSSSSQSNPTINIINPK
jgi:hypothetical protein